MAGIKFSKESARRIARVVRQIENQPPEVPPAFNPANAPAAREFWARLDGSASLGANQWKYAWTQMRRTAAAWEVLPAGRTGTTSAGYALNSIEAANDGAGLEGNGVDRSLPYYPAGFSMQPAPAGAIVRMHADYLGDTTMAYTFSFENAEDGSCEAP